MTHPLSQRIRDVLALQPDGSAIEHEDRWWQWGQLAEFAYRIEQLVTPGTQVGVLLRNRPPYVATLLGLVQAGATLVVINPARGDDRTRVDITALGLPIVIGSPDDVEALVTPSPHTTIVTITDLDDVPLVAQATAPTASEGRAGVAVRMLTSGTTGPPKRVDLTYDMLAHSVMNGPAPKEVRRGVAIVNAPLVHIGGVFRVLQCIAEARPFVLLARFDLDRWAAAVRAHRPRAVSLVPAALRMVLHSDLTREDLDGIQAVTSGTAPLSADDADAFTEKYGIPVLTSYAATEFGGGVAGWSLTDYREFWTSKRGSVGRATLGARLRVVNDDGQQVESAESGLLEVKPGQLGSATDWIRTTDIARIDADGFVWILGRADQAIIRGGFKVMPDDVRAALEGHPAVEGAAVVGRADDRLGETPVAMVELRQPVSATDLVEFLRTRLARYEIPTDIAIVDTIPRTPSGKADLSAVRAHFADTAAATRDTHGT
jgi:acyl-CoA synthetase (AMP-forming)/AMP-acid ligase II